jgi:zinc protease
MHPARRALTTAYPSISQILQLPMSWFGTKEIAMRRCRAGVAHGTWHLRLGVIVLMVAVLAARGSPLAATGDMPTQTSVLSNGLTVVNHEHAGGETVSVAVAVRAGVREEAPDFWGGAHWLEHLLFLGGERYPTTTAVMGAISNLGGEINAHTGPETSTYVVTAPAAALPVVLDVLADILIHPQFPPDAVERERQILLTELRGEGRGDEPTSAETFAEHLVGRVALDPGGTLTSVAALRLEDAIAFKTQHYVARNMTVGVIGPMPHAAIVAAVSRAFAALPPGEQRVSPLPPPEDSLRLAGAGFRVLVGQRIPGLNSPDAAALRVLDAVLDVPGTRMEDAMAEGESTFGGGTIIELYSDVGVWFAYGGGDADEVLSIVQRQIRRLQEELVPEEELRAATRHLAGRLLIGNEFGADQAARLAELSLLGDYETEEAEANRLLSVSAEDIRRVARTYLNPDTFSVMRSVRG